jgi:iron(III) transport system permease protein
MTDATISPAPRTVSRLTSMDVTLAGVAIGVLVCGLLVLVGLPLWMLLSKSFYADGAFVGLANFVTYVTTPSLSRSVGNSLAVAAVTTAIVVPLACA